MGCYFFVLSCLHTTKETNNWGVEPTKGGERLKETLGCGSATTLIVPIIHAKGRSWGFLTYGGKCQVISNVELFAKMIAAIASPYPSLLLSSAVNIHAKELK